MATAGPPRPPQQGGAGGGQTILGGQISAEQIEERMKAEAARLNIPLEQFKQIQRMQQARFEAEAAKAGMTPQQFMAFQQQQLQKAAAEAGMSPQEFLAMKQKEAIEQQKLAEQQQQQQQGQGQPNGDAPQQGQAEPGHPQLQRIDLTKPMEAKPEALAVAKFLRSQDLKTRTCVFDGQRKDMFKVKRAFRALNSPAYEKARAKNPLLPPVTNELEARNAVQLLPLNMLALRVSKKDPNADHEGHGHSHGAAKRIKGLWDVKIEGQQDFEPLMHYMWIYEQPSIKNRVYSVLALLAVFTVVLFPLWPMRMRQGVWYLSVGAMGLLGAFFAMAIFRLILFIITMFTVPPGLWLFPNLFEDVGFIDSFKPLWGWQETKKKKGGKKKHVDVEGKDVGKNGDVAGATTSGADAAVAAAAPGGGSGNVVSKRHVAPTVEEVDDE